MTEDEFEELNRAIDEAGTADRDTPSGPILELLSRRASELNIEAFSESYVESVKALPLNKNFILNKVPAILFNSYFPNRKDVDPQALQKWHLDNLTQSYEAITLSVSSPKSLVNCLEAIVLEIESGGNA